MVKIKNKTAIDTNLKPCKDGYERVAKLVCEEKCKPPRKRDSTTNQCSTPATMARNKKNQQAKSKKATSKKASTKKTTTKKNTAKKHVSKNTSKKCKPKK